MTKLHIGDTVINFGEHGTVIAFHPVTGDPILQNADGMKWVAKADLCKVTFEGWAHKEGLVTFG